MLYFSHYSSTKFRFQLLLLLFVNFRGGSALMFANCCYYSALIWNFQLLVGSNFEFQLLFGSYLCYSALICKFQLLFVNFSSEMLFLRLIRASIIDNLRLPNKKQENHISFSRIHDLWRDARCQVTEG